MPPKTKTPLTPSTTVTARRRTRSQVAPNWTHTETLILVNEIAAVESDCLDALSYYQKWKIITNNCAALDVNRTLDQCRRKWNTLLADYNSIKGWEAENNGEGEFYWGLGRERRRKMGLPEEFQRELFDAVDDVVKAQIERAGLQSGIVVDDADADPLGVIAPPVLIKQTHQLTPQKLQIEPQPEKKVVADKETGMASQLEVNAGTMDIVATKPVKNTGTVEIMATRAREKADSTKVLCAQLREKAEIVEAILEGKLGESKDYTLSGMKQGPGFCTNLARQQCDKLIDCFSVIAGDLDLLCKASPQR